MASPKRCMTPERRKMCLQNFAQYRLNGMISSLRQIYYENSNLISTVPALYEQLTIAVDALEHIKTILKESDHA